MSCASAVAGAARYAGTRSVRSAVVRRVVAVNTCAKVKYGLRLKKLNGQKNSIMRNTKAGRIKYPVAGRPHAGVATPHKSFQKWNPRNPNGGVDKFGKVTSMGWKGLYHARRSIGKWK